MKYIKIISLLMLSLFMLCSCAEETPEAPTDEPVIRTPTNDDYTVELPTEDFLRQIEEDYRINEIQESRGRSTTEELGVFRVIRYYGTYDGISAVYIVGSQTFYQTAIGSETVAGYTFKYSDSNRTKITKNGEFFGISEAYEKGIITEEQVAAIYNAKPAKYEIVFEQEKVRNPLVTLDDETRIKVEKAFENAGYPITWCDVEGDVRRGLRCYGTFDGCTVLFEPSELPVEHTVTIADADFTFSSSFALLGYYEGELLDLQDAYEKGYISKMQIEVAAERHSKAEQCFRDRE